MKFSNTELCTSVKNIVQSTILPGLGDAESQAAAMAVVTAMDELCKRDNSTSGILADLLPVGLAVADDIAQLTASLKLPEAKSHRQQLKRIKALAIDSLQQQAQCYNALLALLESSCLDLLEAKKRTGDNEEINTLIDRAGSWDYAYVRAQAAPLTADAATAEQPQPLTAEKLQRFLAGVLPADSDTRVRDFERIPGGMSKQTYFFKLGNEELVVRKQNDRQLLDLGCLNIKREYHLLKDVFASGFPCPEPLWFADAPADTDGSYFIMKRASGKLLGTFFGTENKLSEKLLLNLAELFARLHSIPMEHFAANINSYVGERYLGATVGQALRYNLEGFDKFWRSLERLPSPLEVSAMRWLQDNIPENTNPAVLTHNDLLVHNFLAEGDNITAVLDWEGACFGDPAADLGYVKAEVSKHIDWTKFLNHYHANGGQAIDENALGYHECLTNLRNLVGTNKHTTAIRSGLGEPKDIMLSYNYVPVFMQIIDRHIGDSGGV